MPSAKPTTREELARWAQVQQAEAGTGPFMVDDRLTGLCQAPRMIAVTAFLAPTCEVRTDEGWLAVDLKEARGRYAMAVKRCPACHGPVNVAGTYTAATRLSMAHRRAHDGCPVNLSGFSGMASPHPQALA